MQPFIHYCHTQHTHAERKETLQKINHMNLHFTSAISLKTEFKIKIRLRLISGSYEAHRNTAGVFTDHHGTDVRNMNIWPFTYQTTSILTHFTCKEIISLSHMEKSLKGLKDQRECGKWLWKAELWLLWVQETLTNIIKRLHVFILGMFISVIFPNRQPTFVKRLLTVNRQDHFKLELN